MRPHICEYGPIACRGGCTQVCRDGQHTVAVRLGGAVILNVGTAASRVAGGGGGSGRGVVTVVATVELPTEVQPGGKGMLLLSLALAGATEDTLGSGGGGGMRYTTVSNQAILHISSRPAALQTAATSLPRATA